MSDGGVEHVFVIVGAVVFSSVKGSRIDLRVSTRVDTIITSKYIDTSSAHVSQQKLLLTKRVAQATPLASSHDGLARAHSATPPPLPRATMTLSSAYIMINNPGALAGLS